MRQQRSEVGVFSPAVMRITVFSHCFQSISRKENQSCARYLHQSSLLALGVSDVYHSVIWSLHRPHTHMHTHTTALFQDPSGSPDQKGAKRVAWRTSLITSALRQSTSPTSALSRRHYRRHRNQCASTRPLWLRSSLRATRTVQAVLMT